VSNVRAANADTWAGVRFADNLIDFRFPIRAFANQFPIVAGKGASSKIACRRIADRRRGTCLADIDSPALRVERVPQGCGMVVATKM
jgi:hypothetical protein